MKKEIEFFEIINRIFRQKTGFISNAQKYAKNKLTFAKKSKKRELAFRFV